MAEKIVSPGVFTTEKDLSFLPVGIGEIGAAIIGPTQKGPAFVPTQIQSFGEFENIFGPITEDYYTPYTVKNYLNSAGTVTVMRILGADGYTLTSPCAIFAGSTSGGGYASASIELTSNGDGDTYYFTGSGGSIYTFIASDLPLPNDNESEKIYYFETGSDTATQATNLSIEMNTVLYTTNNVSMSTSDSNLVISSSEVGTSTNGYGIQSGSTQVVLDGGAAASGKKLAALLHPTTDGDNLNACSITGDSDNFVLTLAGTGVTSTDYSCSFDTASANYIVNVFGTDPNGSKEAYVYKNFKTYHSTLSADTVSVDVAQSLDFAYSYTSAATPWITSQKVADVAENLIKIHTLDHGNTANNSIKVGISNIKAAGTIAGSDYGSFDVTVRGVYGSFGSTDSTTKHDIRETFRDCNLDPDSPNYVCRVIGDQYIDIDNSVTPPKVRMNGDYPSKSNYIRVEVASQVSKKSVSATLVPFGYAAVTEPVSGYVSTGHCPTASVVTSQVNNSEYRPSKVYYGFDYDTKDNLEYLAPTPTNAETGSNVAFYLGDMYGHNSSAGADGSTLLTVTDNTTTLPEQRKFLVPLIGGYDGVNPAVPKNTGADMTAGNTMGFNLGADENGYDAYRKALNILSNADEFDINMIVTPGILHSLASGITQKAMDVCEDRGDCFYVMDSVGLNSNVATAADACSNIDSSYAATYFPWVKILDTARNKHVWVPPSVVIPSVMAYNDRIAHEWFAPAGLTRGGLSGVSEAKIRLTHSDRDTLYENRVNPIATFPAEGVVVWGQKTLQGKPSALDRINVRRLLIALKKFIASSSRYLVFEQNTSATRNRFLNIVNPYMESVQQRSGLSVFKVVMDDTNNTPDIVDRNILYGQIFIQPTRTAEFIVLDFNIMPTGASFPE